MSTAASDRTVVVATYPARHYADMAKNYLADQQIDAYVAADDVHVPLQMTEGARLLVLEHQAQAALGALTDASLLPDDIVVGGGDEDDEAAG